MEAPLRSGNARRRRHCGVRRCSRRRVPLVLGQRPTSTDTTLSRAHEHARIPAPALLVHRRRPRRRSAGGRRGGGGVALDPDVSTGVGVILFFGLALLADMKPVPLDVENERVVSLAFVFVVSSQILFGWEYAVLSACSASSSRRWSSAGRSRARSSTPRSTAGGVLLGDPRLPARRLGRARADHLLRLRRRRRCTSSSTSSSSAARSPSSGQRFLPLPATTSGTRARPS